jgi:exonuclease III
MPHRLSRGETRGAFAGEPLASIRIATVDRTHPNTSRTFGKRAGDLNLRIGTVNVGSMNGRSGEVADMAARRRLDFCCLQETRWKGDGATLLGKKGAMYKFLWAGGKEGLAGVGILVAEKWIEKVIEVKCISERIMVLRVTVGKSVLNIVSVYAPQVGRSTEEKEEFYGVLGKVLSKISTSESLFVRGDMNGHVGKEADGYHGVHGGNRFGSRNMEIGRASCRERV